MASQRQHQHQHFINNIYCRRLPQVQLRTRIRLRVHPQHHLRPSQQAYDLTFSPLHRSLTSFTRILRPRQAVRLRHYSRANMLLVGYLPASSMLYPKVLPPSRTSKRRRNNITNNKHSKHWQCWRRWHRGLLLVRLHRHRCWFGFELGRG